MRKWVRIPRSAATVSQHKLDKSDYQSFCNPEQDNILLFEGLKFCLSRIFLFMTRKEKTKKLIFISFLLIICLALISFYKNPQKQNINPVIESSSKTATLFVNDAKYESKISDQISIYNFMNQLQNEGKITFKEKYYSGMGEFIEEINGIKNGDKNWIYYVNNRKAEIGISNYKIKTGDVVSWKYE